MKDLVYYGKMAISILVMMICVIFLSGCKTTSYVPMEKIVYRDVVRIQKDTICNTDSVWLKDSVVVTQRGDTVYRDRWHTKVKSRYVYQVRTDTVFTKDSLEVQKPVSMEKLDEKLSRTKCYAFFSLVLSLLLGLYLYKRIREYLKNSEYGNNS